MARLDPTISTLASASKAWSGCTKSRAIILNIDYPLGLAAYYIFVQVAESLENIRGMYVLGKAATLNGRIGDVMISDSVFDEHSQNTYWLNNCFTAADVAPFLVYGSVLDNQKAVTVKGTYLQNRPYLDFYYQRQLHRGRDGSRALPERRSTNTPTPRATPSRSISTSPSCPSTSASSTTPRTRLTHAARTSARSASPTWAWTRPTPPRWPSCAACSSWS